MTLASPFLARGLRGEGRERVRAASRSPNALGESRSGKHGESSDPSRMGWALVDAGEHEQATGV
jgi:hypothetical protein